MTAVVIVAPVGADASYTHTQAVAASVWTITHNLGKRPSVAVQDSSGTVVIGQVQYLDSNTVQLTFSAPFSGRADLN